MKPDRKNRQPKQDEPLPRDLGAERFLLAWCLQNPGQYAELAKRVGLTDFSTERHRRIFACMGELYARDMPIDLHTLMRFMHERKELGPDGVAALVDLEEGMPELLNVEGYIKILHQQRAMREAMSIGNQLYNAAATANGNVPHVVEQVQELLGRFVEEQGAQLDETIRFIEDLESIFNAIPPVDYLIEPELPARAVTYLAGDSEGGKSTLACAWARNLVELGHAVLLLDRDKNPRAVICDRMKRLGVADSPLLRVWDAQQHTEAPQPDAPIVIDWVKRMAKQTGLSPLVIGDSLIAFFQGEETENDSNSMRAVFDRFRAVTAAGGTALILAHLGKNGELRGSSDFKPAADQGFIVTNFSPDGGRLLDKITLEVHKSRYGLTTSQIWNYLDGKMARNEDGFAAIKTITQQLTALLRQNPGIGKRDFQNLAIARRVPKERARQFLNISVQSRNVILLPNTERGGGRYYLAEQAPVDRQEGLDL